MQTISTNLGVTGARRRRVLALTLVVGLMSAPAVWGQVAESLEARLRAELRSTTQQLRDLQSEQARLQAARATAETQRVAALAKVDALQGRLSNGEGKIQAQRRASQSRIDASQQRAEQVRGAYDELLTLARQKEAQRLTLKKQARQQSAALKSCVERNGALYQAGREILDAYQNLGTGDIFRMRQPLAASARVQFEDKAQDFGDRLYNNQVQVTETPSNQGEPAHQAAETENHERTQ